MSVSPARCLRCYYVIDGLRDHVCPECGRKFDPLNEQTFTRNAPLVRWRLWMPALLLACVTGVLSLGLMGLMGFEVGWGITIITPGVMGILIGYRHLSGPLSKILIAASAVILVLSMILAADFMGIVCGIVAVLMFIVPIAIGTAMGAGLRRFLKTTRFDQARWLPIALVILPSAIAFAEHVFRSPGPIVAVSTTRIVPHTPDDTWERLRFYDNINTPPPPLFTLGFPRPVSTEGSFTNVGDTQVCRYDHGFIVKELESSEPGRLLRFRVLEQHVGFERSLRLVAGSFELDGMPSDAPPSQTRLTLTTEYEVRLFPRFAWAPIERLYIHTLHDYIMDGSPFDDAQSPDEQIAQVEFEHGDDANEASEAKP